MQHQEKCILALQVHGQQQWRETGSALSQLLLRQLSHFAQKNTLDTQSSASASPNHFSAVQSFKQ